MSNLETQIINQLARPNYHPLKPKALARRLSVPSSQYSNFRKVLRELVQKGRIEFGRNHTVRQVAAQGAVTGIFRKASGGFGFVRPHTTDDSPKKDIHISEAYVGDALTGDEVLVKIRSGGRRANLGPTGEIVQVLERATNQFVGTYFERDGKGYVRVDGGVFRHSVYVGDPGAKGVREKDKVVFDMLRFPTPEEDRGEGVITEILGARGQPGVDTLSIIRSFGLPDAFPDEVLDEARRLPTEFDEEDVANREDFTKTLTVTIDPADAHDFDDAVSLTKDPKTKHWTLTVHIADVAHYVAPGSLLDREARKRGNSVYLPQKVLPMFPEILSNGLASLQQGRERFVKSVVIDFTPSGQETAVRFSDGVIKVTQRFSYDGVTEFFKEIDGAKGKKKKKSAKEEVTASAEVEPDIAKMLLNMRDLAMKLRKRRMKRGSLHLSLPETELEYDEQGGIAGAHFRKQEVSHQIIEEFMLAANEAVAGCLHDRNITFLRRIHPSPDAKKLQNFADFAGILGYKIESAVDRFALQQVLTESTDKPDMYAVHFALLRSLKQAVYSPEVEPHYALASENYCHFTSPIRRYPDLVIHRLLGQWLRTGNAGSDVTELTAIGEHCSKTERRGDMAERELIRVKLLNYLSTRMGMELEVIITGVADYGFFGQAEKLPVEGLVHASTLTDDYYHYEESSHSLIGKTTKKRYRLGDKVRVKVVRVDLQRRQMDYRVVEEKDKGGRRRQTEPKAKSRKSKKK